MIEISGFALGTDLLHPASGVTDLCDPKPWGGLSSQYYSFKPIDNSAGESSKARSFLQSLTVERELSAQTAARQGKGRYCSLRAREGRQPDRGAFRNCNGARSNRQYRAGPQPEQLYSDCG
jgi:hypothetical protein